MPLPKPYTVRKPFQRKQSAVDAVARAWSLLDSGFAGARLPIERGRTPEESAVYHLLTALHALRPELAASMTARVEAIGVAKRTRMKNAKPRGGRPIVAGTDGGLTVEYPSVRAAALALAAAGVAAFGSLVWGIGKAADTGRPAFGRTWAWKAKQSRREAAA